MDHKAISISPWRLPRPIYVVGKFFYDLVAVLSRLLNATVFGGSTCQTLSARSYLESLTCEKWAARRRFINRLFFWQDDHCKEQWEYEVMLAHKTLELNEASFPS